MCDAPLEARLTCLPLGKPRPCKLLCNSTIFLFSFPFHYPFLDYAHINQDVIKIQTISMKWTMLPWSVMKNFFSKKSANGNCRTCQITSICATKLSAAFWIRDGRPWTWSIACIFIHNLLESLIIFRGEPSICSIIIVLHFCFRLTNFTSLFLFNGMLFTLETLWSS